MSKERAERPEPMEHENWWKRKVAYGREIHGNLSTAYYYGGLPAVESELIRMMEGK